jgi:hypothetical protein
MTWWLLFIVFSTGTTSTSPATTGARPIAVYATERACQEASARAYLQPSLYKTTTDGTRFLALKCHEVPQERVTHGGPWGAVQTAAWAVVKPEAGAA